MQISIGKPMVFVPDLEEATRFYCETLGLSLVEHATDRVLVRGADFDLILFPCDSNCSSEGYASVAGSTISFQVADLDAAVLKLRSARTRILHDAPQQGPYSRYVAFADPFGTVHELVEALS